MGVSEGVRPEDTVVIRQILAALPTMPPALRKVGKFVAEHPDEVLGYSVTELGELTETSEASVVRFCRLLNYKGFQDFKIHLSRSLVGPLRSLQEDISPDDSPGVLTRKVFATSIQTLSDTLEVLDEEAMGRAIKALSQARRVVCVGFGGSAAVAYDAHHKFLKTSLVSSAYSDSHMAIMVASTLGAGDVLFAVSHSGTTEDMLEVVSVAKEAGAVVIAVTNRARSPLVRAADISLFTTSPETRYRSEGMASRIAQLCIIDALYIGVMIAKQPDALDTLEKTRRAVTIKHL